MLKILLTGSQGQVGSSIRALVSNHNNKIENIKLFACSRADCDIADRTAVNNIFNKIQPDVVINAAAYTAVDKAEEDVEQAEKINVYAVENLALACQKLNIPMLHISTDYVFDGTQSLPYAYQETDETNPLGIYGKTKLAGEKKLQESCEKFIVLRTSWVFSEYGNNFVKTMLKLFKQKETLSIVSDQYGGPTSADAIAKALLIIAKKVTEKELDLNQNKNLWGVYHFAGQPVVNWCEFATKISELDSSERKIIKNILPITAAKFGAKAPRPMNSALDISKIKQVFNIDVCDWQQDVLKIINLSTERCQTPVCG